MRRSIANVRVINNAASRAHFKCRIQEEAVSSVTAVPYATSGAADKLKSLDSSAIKADRIAKHVLPVIESIQARGGGAGPNRSTQPILMFRKSSRSGPMSSKIASMTPHILRVDRRGSA
jgi:hypothetical protein